jgi:pimeloyl-ACP methyl ester carboxylesterase
VGRRLQLEQGEYQIAAAGFQRRGRVNPLDLFQGRRGSIAPGTRQARRSVVLVGHSYGGAVVTAAGASESNVKALVYIAAIVPDEGETVGKIFGRVSPDAKAPKLQPDSDGLI